eukprot:gene18601-32785_t
MTRSGVVTMDGQTATQGAAADQSRTSTSTYITQGKTKMVKALDDRSHSVARLPQSNGEAIQVVRYQVGEKYVARWSRASIPFAVSERNANCLLNGVMLFAYKTDGSVSHARFQITQETCVYFKVDYWGQLPVTLTPESFNLNRFLSAREMYEDEVRNIFPSRPLSELADKGVDPTVYGKSLTQQHVTTRGVVHQGVNYIGECITRTGGYSGHCSQMAVPSYSTAKGIFAGFAMMRLAEKYGVEVYDELIQTWLPGEVASAT